MCLKEMGAKTVGLAHRHLATDLSTEVLEKAKAGIYSQFEVQRGLPIQLLIKYFTQIGETWQIAPEIRAMVQFRPLNLLQRLHPARHVRRGVLPQRADLFRPAKPRSACSNASRAVTERDGYLVLGAAETVVGLTDSFNADRRTARTLRAGHGRQAGESPALRASRWFRRALVAHSAASRCARVDLAALRCRRRIVAPSPAVPTLAHNRGLSHEGRPSHQPRARVRRRDARRRHRRAVDRALCSTPSPRPTRLSLMYARQERVAFDICDGFARASGNPAVVFTDAGPAAANLMGGHRQFVGGLGAGAVHRRPQRPHPYRQQVHQGNPVPRHLRARSANGRR